jgi:hypothetical protein
MIKCPKCPGTMHPYERSGIQIEQCDSCRGIFLDFGELEALTRFESQLQQPAPQYQQPAPQYQQPAPQYQQPYPPQYQQGPGWGGHGGHHGGHYRRRGFGSLFFSS